WTGLVALGNGAGVDLSYATNNIIEGNVISGNAGRGIEMDAPVSGNAIQGNKIGTDPVGNQGNLPGWESNGSGVSTRTGLGNQAQGIVLTESNNTIGGLAAGAGNTIAFNGGNGVEVFSGTGDSILSNSIHDNGGLGIYLNNTNNANDKQAAPVLTSASSSSSGTT